MMSADSSRRLEDNVRDGMVRQLRQNLAKCRKVILDEKMDLKTRERWTQLYNNTSQVLNQILKDRQMRDWENRLRIIEEDRKNQRRPQGMAGKLGIDRDEFSARKVCSQIASLTQHSKPVISPLREVNIQPCVAASRTKSISRRFHHSTRRCSPN